MIDKGASLKVIVHAPNWVGDHIMAFPFYSVLKEALPKAKLYLIGRSWISSIIPENTFADIIILFHRKTITKYFMGYNFADKQF